MRRLRVLGAASCATSCAEALHVLDGDAQQLHGVVRPSEAHELYERHDVLAVRALGVPGLPAADPRFKNTG